MSSKPLAWSKPWENTTNHVTNLSKPSKRKAPLKMVQNTIKGATHVG
jgi:hypothetical protein